MHLDRPDFEVGHKQVGVRQVKFVLIPLLIVGMFVSFTAAMVAMLFFTRTVESPEQLQKIVSGQVDQTRLSDKFTDPEQKLEGLIELGELYRSQYEIQLKVAEELRDSLLSVEAKLQTDQAMLKAEQALLSGEKDAVRQQALKENLTKLATFYNKMKAPAAAEILQAGVMDDTTVGMLLEQLQKAGVDYDNVTEVLEREGVEKFILSFEELLAGIEAKRETVVV